jgi:hypothetical protein
MNVLSSRQQEHLLLDHDAHGAPNLSAGHVIGPDQVRGTTYPEQVYLGFTVTEYMDVGWLVVVGEDNHPQAVGAQHGHRSAM